MITLKDVSKSFGPVRAVARVSFDVGQGEVVGFLGPNGAGKSTTMRMITGYLPADSGQITVSGIDVATDAVAAKAKVGYLPESAALYTDMEVVDFLLFMGRMRGLTHVRLKQRLKVVVHDCQLAPVLGRRIATLSKGFRQRVGLAQALLHDPDVLILDEPTVGLDPNQIGEIRSLIKEIGQTKTILLSTHILQEVNATCRRVLIINNGTIVAAGTPETLVKQSAEAATYELNVRGTLAEINRRLTELPHYQNHEVKESQDGRHEVIVRCAGEQDMSEEIFQLAVAHKWTLSKLVRGQQSLEDVFKKLTA